MSERIVPVTCTDLLSLYKTMLNIAETETQNVEPKAGVVSIDSNPSKALFAVEPVSGVAVDEEVTAYSLYFVPAYDFVNPFEGAEIEADGKTLYKATLAEGTVTVVAVSA